MILSRKWNFGFELVVYMIKLVHAWRKSFFFLLSKKQSLPHSDGKPDLLHPQPNNGGAHIFDTHGSTAFSTNATDEQHSGCANRCQRLQRLGLHSLLRQRHHPSGQRHPLHPTQRRRRSSSTGSSPTPLPRRPPAPPLLRPPPPPPRRPPPYSPRHQNHLRHRQLPLQLLPRPHTPHPPRPFLNPLPRRPRCSVLPRLLSLRQRPPSPSPSPLPPRRPLHRLRLELRCALLPLPPQRHLLFCSWTVAMLGFFNLSVSRNLVSFGKLWLHLTPNC